MTLGDPHAVLRQVDDEGSNLAIQPEGLEKGVSHYRVPGPAGLHAIAAGNGVVGAVLVLRRDAGVQHRPKNIGKSDIFRLGDLDADVAQIAEIQIQIFDGAVGVFHPAGHLAHAAGRTLNHADAIGLKTFDDGFGFHAVGLADALFIRLILMIVHAVTSRGDGGFEAEAIIGHARQEARGLFAAPAVLAHRNVQFRHTHREVVLHNA